MKKFLITLAVLLGLGMVAGGFILWYAGRAALGITLEFTVPDDVLVGVPFDLEMQVGNGSRGILKDARVSLLLPQGIVAVGGERGRTLETKMLGDVGAGSLARTSFTVLVLSGESSIVELPVTLSYQPANLGSRFEKQGAASIAVSGSGIDLDLAAPNKVLSGEEFETKVSYRNVSGGDVADARIIFEYPPAYALISASSRPDIGANTWNLGLVERGEAGEIAVRGKLVGPENSFMSMKVRLEASVSGKFYPVAEETASLAIVASPLSLEVAVNGSAEYIAHPKDKLQYTLAFRNGTGESFRDVVIRAKPVGELFNLGTVSGAGFLRSGDNTLVWNAGNTPALALLGPGASGEVSFSVDVRDAYPIRRVNDKNFILKLESEIESPTVPRNLGVQTVATRVVHETKVGGRVVLDAKGLFRDAASGIVNGGAFPPRVGEATQFTVHWQVVNYATDIRDVEVKAFLGGNVRFVGAPKSNTGAVPVYNDRTQELVWTVPRIPATRGVLDVPAEAIFQVELTPSVNQAGKVVTLLEKTSLRAVDEFTGEAYAIDDTGVTTELKDDPTVGQGQGVVVQ